MQEKRAGSEAPLRVAAGAENSGPGGVGPGRRGHDDVPEIVYLRRECGVARRFRGMETDGAHGRRENDGAPGTRNDASRA